MRICSKLKQLIYTTRSAVRSDSIVFAMTGAYGLTGGIASLNRNIFIVLADLAKDFNIKLHVLSLHEADKDVPPHLANENISFVGFQGDTKRFSLSLIRFSLQARFTLFDHIRLAIPLLPFSAVGLVRVIAYCHGPEAWGRIRASSRLAFQNAEICLTNSAFTLRKMRERLGRFNGVACPLGLPPEHVLHEVIPEFDSTSPRLKNLAGNLEEIGAQMLLLVGRMHSQQEGKGHREILAALAQIVDRHPKVQVVFAGTGDDSDAIAALARQLGVQNQVFMPGFVSLEMLGQLYRNSYAFVMPSRQDGFGLVFLEAMNYAKPCVAAYDGGGECVIKQGETGILVHNNGDITGLVDALNELLCDPELASEMGRRGFELLHREFSSTKFQHRLRTNLQDML